MPKPKSASKKPVSVREVVFPEKQEFLGAPRELASSACPRFDLIPFDALCVMADRFELGLKIHGEKAWNAQNAEGLTKEFVIGRLNHVIRRCNTALESLRKGDGSFTVSINEDAGAIMFGGAVLAYFNENLD